MEMIKARSLGMMVFGLILLAGGILILVFVPGWGKWIAGYPAQLMAMPFPPEAAAVAKGFGGALGPLMQQVGGYMRIAGYFVGSLMTIIAIGLTGAGFMMFRED